MIDVRAVFQQAHVSSQSRLCPRCFCRGRDVTAFTTTRRRSAPTSRAAKVLAGLADRQSLLERARRWPLHSSSNCICISEVILVTLAKGLGVSGRYLSHIMIERKQFASHKVCRHASLDTDQAWRYVCQPAPNPAASKLLSQNDRFVPIQANQVQGVVACVDADRAHGYNINFPGHGGIRLSQPHRKPPGALARPVHPVLGSRGPGATNHCHLVFMLENARPRSHATRMQCNQLASARSRLRLRVVAGRVVHNTAGRSSPFITAPCRRPISRQRHKAGRSRYLRSHPSPAGCR